MNGRHVRRSRVALAAGLHQDANEFILSPSVKRLARKKCRNAERAAHHLASLECQVLLGASLVTHHNIEFGSQCFFKEFGNEVPAGSRARGRAFRRLRRFAHVFN